MELPGLMGDIQKAHDYLEAKESGQHKKTPAAMTYLTLVSAGAVMTELRVLFGDEPWRELIWRIPFGAAVIWLPNALMVFLFGAGKIEGKKALVLGAVPSLFSSLVPSFLSSPYRF